MLQNVEGRFGLHVEFGSGCGNPVQVSDLVHFGAKLPVLLGIALDGVRRHSLEQGGKYRQQAFRTYRAGMFRLRCHRPQLDDT